MKFTKEKIKQIIKEEIEKYIFEDDLSDVAPDFPPDWEYTPVYGDWRDDATPEEIAKARIRQQQVKKKRATASKAIIPKDKSKIPQKDWPEVRGKKVPPGFLSSEEEPTGVAGPDPRFAQTMGVGPEGTLIFPNTVGTLDAIEKVNDYEDWSKGEGGLQTPAVQRAYEEFLALEKEEKKSIVNQLKKVGKKAAAKFFSNLTK